MSEFPELQGLMGRTYARLQGEPEAIAEAIYEHYLPNRSGGPVPARIEGSLLSIADKIDTIAACFGVGMLPTGTADPFALRRQTLGIIRIVLETPLRISLGEVIDKALVLLSKKLTQPAEDVRRDILAFFEGRLHNYLAPEGGFSPDVIEAALSVGMDDLLETVATNKALAHFTARPDFGALATALRGWPTSLRNPRRRPLRSPFSKTPPNGSSLSELSKAEQAVDGLLTGSDFAGALESMAHLKPMIDSFFDSVLVMDKEDSVRRNRLALLTRTRNLFARVADFRKIQTP